MSELPTVSSKDGIRLHDTLITFDEDHHSGVYDTLIIGHHQDIPDDWVADLKRDKIDADHAPISEWLHFATIPDNFYEQMMKEGVDPDHASAKEIVRWLRQKQLDAFITTNKQV